MKTPYETLGIGRNASDYEIKRAYHRLAHQYHPDKNPGDRAAEDCFKEITRAYELLSDPLKRQAYDRFGRGFKTEQPKMDIGDIGSVFRDIFADFVGQSPKMQQERGANRQCELSIDFAKAVKGGDHPLQARIIARCESCVGTGAQAGSTPQICRACEATGEVKIQQGFFRIRKRCSYCGGRGRIISAPCKSCTGKGHAEVDREITIRIPPGATDGAIVIYAGGGEPGRNGGGCGDLEVVLRVASHPIFKRNGPNIFCELPITVSEASLGAQVDVPTVDGRVRMKIPPGTQSGKTFRLAGRGLPKLGSSERGDQHITVIIETPEVHSEEQQRLLQELSRFDTSNNLPKRSAFWAAFSDLHA